MRFMDAKPDGRAIVYAHIQADPLVARAADLLADATATQRVLARAAMNGESTDPATWRAMFPTLFGATAPAPGEPTRDRSEAILATSLEVADRGEQTRSQVRGAIIEALTERLLAVRTGPVRRERRILFDGRPAEIHPYVLDRAAPSSVADPGARAVDDLHQGRRLPTQRFGARGRR